MDISIRQATAGDLDVVVRFNQAMALETEDKALSQETVTDGVLKALEDPERSRYFLAVSEGLVVGQIMFTLEWSDWRDGWFWWLQSVYVQPDARGQGVFSRLYRYVQNLARSQPDVCGLRLYVESDNELAQAVYRSLGMNMTGYRVMEAMFPAGGESDA